MSPSQLPQSRRASGSLNSLRRWPRVPRSVGMMVAQSGHGRRLLPERLPLINVALFGGRARAIALAAIDRPINRVADKSHGVHE